jgi:hypothetical protein
VAGRIARGDIRLYRFAKPDKDRPVVVLTRDSALSLSIDCYHRPDYFHDSGRAFGSGAERRRRHEEALRRKPAQRGYRLSAAPR